MIDFNLTFLPVFSVCRQALCSKFHHQCLQIIFEVFHVVLPVRLSLDILHSFSVEKLTFTRTHVNFTKHDSIRKIETHCSEVKHCNFSKSRVKHLRCILVRNSGTKLPIGSIFLPSHNCTLTYRFPVLSQFSSNARCAGFSLSGSQILL